MKDGNAARAAQAVGYTAAHSHNLMRDPYVVEALEKARKRSQEVCDYNATQAMKEANDAIEFAISTENANAYVKAVELRAKLQGLLVEKVDLRAQVGFSIIMAPLRPGKTEPEPVPTTDFTVLPPAAAPTPVGHPGQDLPTTGAAVAAIEEDPFAGLEDDDPFA